MDEAIAARLFGKVTGEDGKAYQFDPRGPISKAWVEDGKRTGEWPMVRAAYVYTDGRKYVVFEGGRTYLVSGGQVRRLAA
jgi:hypothetical protein